MTPRSIRRAAERKARKLALKAEKIHAQIALDATRGTGADLDQKDFDEELCFCPEPDDLPGISAAQLAANRANAQLSSGPTSETGKAKSSLNAVKTALTGRTVLLPSDDAAQYERYLHAYQEELKPVGQRESDLAQSIADTSWRLVRIPGLELAIYAQGRMRFANSFDEHDLALRPGMIELQTFLAYEKQLRNLQLQEARLHRRREKDTAELRKLQQERKTKEVEALDAAAKQYLIAKKSNSAFTPAANGFEFSAAEIERYLEGVSPSWIARVTAPADRDLELAAGSATTTTQAA